LKVSFCILAIGPIKLGFSESWSRAENCDMKIFHFCRKCHFFDKNLKNALFAQIIKLSDFHVKRKISPRTITILSLKSLRALTDENREFKVCHFKQNDRKLSILKRWTRLIITRGRPETGTATIYRREAGFNSYTHIVKSPVLDYTSPNWVILNMGYFQTFLWKCCIFKLPPAGGAWTKPADFNMCV